MQEPRSHLLSLGLSDSEVTVYLAMVGGARTARDLQKLTELKRPTIYYALGCLEKRSLISKTGLEGDKRFFLEPFDRLKTIAQEKSQEATRLQQEITGLIPFFASSTKPANQKPTVAFYEGTEAVKNVVMEVLSSKKKKIESIAPDNNFFWGVGSEFVKRFVSERSRRGIVTRNLWESKVKPEVIQMYYSGPSEVRILPPSMKDKFSTVIFLYDDKTLYVSSLKNSYCVLITSQEHHDTMQAIFEGLWGASKKH